MSDTDPQQSVAYYRISPEYRRSLFYVLVGGILLLVFAERVNRFVPNRKPVGPFLIIIGSSVLALAVSVPLRWAVRIDGAGFARRWLFRWEVWPWCDFAGGLVAKRHPFTLIHLERPWWRRRLSLSYLPRADIMRAMEAINAHYRLPEPTEIPESLTIKYGFRHRAILSSEGIRVSHFRNSREFRWHDVLRVHITRMDPFRHDFKRLEIVLPDEVIQLEMVCVQGRWQRNWSGVTAECVNTAVFRYMPNERIDVDIVGKRPARRSDVEAQLGEIRSMQREQLVMMWVLVPLFLAVLIWMGIKDNWLLALFMGMGIAAMTVPVFLCFAREESKRSRELEAWAATYDEDASPSRD